MRRAGRCGDRVPVSQRQPRQAAFRERRDLRLGLEALVEDGVVDRHRRNSVFSMFDFGFETHPGFSFGVESSGAV